MISDDAIHFQTKGGVDENAESINTLKDNDCDHNQDKEHAYVAYGMDKHLVWVQMIEE
jgi:hypothetical protein